MVAAGELPPLPMEKKDEIRRWIWKEEIPVESSIPELFWQTTLFLQQIIELMWNSSVVPMSEIAISGHSAHDLLQDYTKEVLRERGFLKGDEEPACRASSKELLVCSWLNGDADKNSIRATLKGVSKYLADLLSPNLCGRYAADIIQRKYPEKYPEGIKDDQIKDAVIGNTAFETLYVDKEQRYMTVALGNLKVVVAQRMTRSLSVLKILG